MFSPIIHWRTLTPLTLRVLKLFAKTWLGHSWASNFTRAGWVCVWRSFNWSQQGEGLSHSVIQLSSNDQLTYFWKIWQKVLNHNRSDRVMNITLGCLDVQERSTATFYNWAEAIVIVCRVRKQRGGGQVGIAWVDREVKCIRWLSEVTRLVWKHRIPMEEHFSKEESNNLFVVAKYLLSDKVLNARRDCSHAKILHGNVMQ